MESAPASVLESTATTASNTLTSSSTAASINGAPENRHKPLAEAVAVDDRTIVVADPIEGVTEDQTREDRKQINIFAGIGVLAIIIAIVLAVLLSPRDTGNPGADSANESGINVDPPSGQVETEISEDLPLPLEDYDERRENMIALLEPLYKDSEGGVEVFNASSPFASEDRIASLEWLIKDSDVPTGDDEDYESQVYKILQRYVLATLYTATKGENWKLQFNFLSGIDECQWSNIYTHLIEDDDLSYVEDEFSVKGAICNDAGKLVNLRMWWNGMSGTLPQELSFFSDSLEELNLVGGSISGSIPSSFTKLANLATLGLSDNCLTGDLPAGINFIDMPKLGIVIIHNNKYIVPASNNLETYCNGSGGPNEGVIALTVDCPTEEFGLDEFGNATKIPYGCDCCICCTPEEYQCTQLASGGSWTSYFLDDLSPDGFPMGFDSQCVSVEQQTWIAENCPCVINITTSFTLQPFRGKCVTDCSQEGAIPSYDFGS